METNIFPLSGFSIELSDDGKLVKVNLYSLNDSDSDNAHVSFVVSNGGFDSFTKALNDANAKLKNR